MKRLTTKHLDFLTDDFGVWQHTDGYMIDKNRGYALDDVARALLVAVELGDLRKIRIYVKFLQKAISKDRVILFFDKNRNPLPKTWSEDALGEAYWALSDYKKKYRVKNRSALQLIKNCEHWVEKMSSIRGRAYSLIGASGINLKLAEKLAGELFEEYTKTKTQNWPWLEPELSYANAIIPLSFLEAYAALCNKKYLRAGIEMLDFLNSKTRHNGKPIAVGNKGWLPKGRNIALFDQQPIDPAYQVMANIKAFLLTEKNQYKETAEHFLSWFWGNNLLGKPLINLRAESCHDGLNKDNINQNQGAENIVCYLLAQEKIWPYL